MLNDWKKTELDASITNLVSLYEFRGENYMVRHFPFAFFRLNSDYTEALKNWGKPQDAGRNSGAPGIIAEIEKYLVPGEVKPEGDKYLRRLNLIVAQKCNSRCKYCYAGDGNYGKDAFMPLETAEKAIFSALNGYEKVETIQFFGGEPFLAPELIEKSIEYAEKTAMSLGKKVPQFSAVSNLTILPENIFNLIKQGKLNVITSLDGPAELHDKNRIFADGRPTHDVVVENIRKLSPFSQPRSIEATYTAAHLEAGVTPLRVREYINSICPGASVVIVPELGLSKSAREGMAHFEFREYCAGRLSFEPEKLQKTLNGYLGITRAARHGIFCDLGRNNFTVDAEGRVWPCQMVCGKSEPIGAITEDWMVIRGRFEAGPGKDFKKSNFSDCGACFLREYCTSCPLAWEKESGRPAPVRTQCEMDRKVYLTAFIMNFKNQKKEKFNVSREG